MSNINSTLTNEQQADVVQSAVVEVLAREFGVFLNNDIRNLKTDRYGVRKFFNLDFTENSKNFGLFKMVMESAHISVLFEETYRSLNGYWAIVSLTYTHPGGGMNGFNIATLWISEGNSEFPSVKYQLENGEIKDIC